MPRKNHRHLTLNGRVLSLTLLILAAALTGCDSQPRVSPGTPAAASSPAPPTTAPTTAEPPIVPESASWSREMSLKMLAEDANERVQRSAAVRLARLSSVKPLCVPDPLPDRLAERIQVRALGTNRWAFGFASTMKRAIDAPALIDSAGEVSLPVSEAEEEVATLYVSDDSEVFPHLVITPVRVVALRATDVSALVAKRVAGTRFAYRRKEDKWPYVAAVLRPTVPAASAPSTPSASSPASAAASAGAPTTQKRAASAEVDAAGRIQPEAADQEIEIAEYRWDPFEEAFVGPVAEKLPEPPGGRFELSLTECKALVPVGGDIPDQPAPKPQNKRPPPPPE